MKETIKEIAKSLVMSGDEKALIFFFFFSLTKNFNRHRERQLRKHALGTLPTDERLEEDFLNN